MYSQPEKELEYARDKHKKLIDKEEDISNILITLCHLYDVIDEPTMRLFLNSISININNERYSVNLKNIDDVLDKELLQLFIDKYKKILKRVRENIDISEDSIHSIKEYIRNNLRNNSKSTY